VRARAQKRQAARQMKRAIRRVELFGCDDGRLRAKDDRIGGRIVQVQDRAVRARGGDVNRHRQGDRFAKRQPD